MRADELENMIANPAIDDDTCFNSIVSFLFSEEIDTISQTESVQLSNFCRKQRPKVIERIREFIERKSLDVQ